MARSDNTNIDGKKWSKETLDEVWNKGKVIPTFPAETWRLDQCGSAMKFSEHGNRKSEVGWEIDHINPVSNGGLDTIENLQPLNWVNNVLKNDKLGWDPEKIS